MRRWQLIEIAEQPWCPPAVRDGLTDYLQFVIDRTRPYDAAAPLVADLLRATAANGSAAVPASVVDLGSGAGGPWRALAPAVAALLGAPVRVCLTDRYPNAAAHARLAGESGGAIVGEARPVAADAVPADLSGVRTIFSAFHHFPPTQARRVLADAVANAPGLAVFEATRRDARAIGFMFATPLVVLASTPLIRPFRWSRLVLTYLLPVIPLAVLWDGVVSCLRSYTPAELRALAAGVGADDYVWDAGETGGGPIPMTYLVGHPAPRPAAAPVAER